MALVGYESDAYARGARCLRMVRVAQRVKHYGAAAGPCEKTPQEERRRAFARPLPLCQLSIMNEWRMTAVGRERRRVQRHLIGAERMARGSRVRLDPLTAVNRALLLDELRRYRRAGRFPLNHAFRDRLVPEFIDAHGTRCAMAHLMQISGQAQLVRHIARTENNARVRELARLPELRAWLAAAGLSVEDAARIQPTYCFITEAEACFCNQGARTNLALGTVVAQEQPDELRVRVDRLEGDFPGLDVGDERVVQGEGRAGAQILFSREPGDGLVQRLGLNLEIDGNSVRCQLNRDTRMRPVTVDTVFEAMLAPSTPSGGNAACVDVLRTDDSAWNESQCDASESDDGCGLVTPDGSSMGTLDLTSAALFVALVAYRRRQRASGSAGRRNE
ncbi:MAG: hypothetical protein ABW217_14145 [Polyangiaceae bacterium]